MAARKRSRKRTTKHRKTRKGVGAARRRRSTGRCKVVSVNGRRRRICWHKNGKIRSNTRAR